MSRRHPMSDKDFEKVNDDNSSPNDNELLPLVTREVGFKSD